MLSINRLIHLLSVEQECVGRDCDRNCTVCDLVQDQHELIEAYASVIELLYSVGFLTGEISQGNTPHYSYYIYRTLCDLCGVRPMSKIKFAFWYAKNFKSVNSYFQKLLEKLGVANG